MPRSPKRARAADGTMSLGEHLSEVRRRLVRSAGAVLVAAIVGWFASDTLFSLLRYPVSVLKSSRDNQIALNFTSVSGAFDLRLEIAITVGIILSSPVWLYQVLAFFLPALTRRGRRYLVGFVAATVPLFLAGCAAGFLVLPHMVKLLIGLAPAESALYLEAGAYLDFVLKLVLVTGVAFILPVVLVILNFMGVVRGITVLHGWRWAAIAITVFTAIATPAADVLSMFLLALPMVVLYLAACGVSLLHDRRTDLRLERVAASAALEMED